MILSFYSPVGCRPIWFGLPATVINKLELSVLTGAIAEVEILNSEILGVGELEGLRLVYRGVECCQIVFQGTSYSRVQTVFCCIIGCIV